MDAHEIDRRCRAFEHDFHVYSTWPPTGQQLKFFKVHDPTLMQKLELDRLARSRYSPDNDTPIEPGLIYYHKKRKLLCIKSANDTWSGFGAVKLESKRRMSAVEFYSGYLSKLSSPVILE